MKIFVNGAPEQTTASTLGDLLIERGQANAKVATAVNEAFVAAPLRALHTLDPGDRVEIVAPRQGG